MVKFSRNGLERLPKPVSGVPPPETAVPPPKVVAPPPGDAVLYFWSVFFPENRYNCCQQRSDLKAYIDLRGLLLRGGRRGEGRKRERRGRKGKGGAAWKCRVPPPTFE